MGFEHGWNAIANAMATDIEKWADFKVALRQLKSDEIKAKFDTVTIDTVSIAWTMCEKYICAQQGVQNIADIPWGKGYSLCKEEFASCLRQITQMGYGLVILAHDEEVLEKNGDTEIRSHSPAIPKRAKEIVNQLVDIIGYVDVTFDNEGKSKRLLYTRKTPTVFAGSRFPYLAPVIPFGYDELVNAIADAIDKSAENGATVVDKTEKVTSAAMTFKEIQDEAKTLWGELVAKNEDNAAIILKKVEMIFGGPKKLSEITEDQVDLFYLVLLDMREMAG